MNSKCVVTSGWDDGHKLDLKLAKLLTRYKVRGTFFIPIHYLNKKLSENDLIALSKDFEIGAHTLTHPHLTEIPLEEAEREVVESKRALENLLGQDVVGLSYPYGHYNNEIAKLVKKAYYKYAFALYKIGVHVYPHVGLRNILKFVATVRPLTFMRFSFLTYAKHMFDHVYTNSGVWYLWGHSWEVEHFGMWDELEKVLKYVSNRPDVLYLTNYEMTQVMRSFTTQEGKYFKQSKGTMSDIRWFGRQNGWKVWYRILEGE